MLDSHARIARPDVPEPSASAWWRRLFGALSPAGTRGRLAVVMFHRVHPSPDPLFPGELDVLAFRERLRWLHQWFNVLPLDSAVASLARGTLPARALAITFDDGYADNVNVALPVLRELDLPATFFIATGFLDGGRMWNDTVIETVRLAPGPRLDLTNAGLASYDIGTPQTRRATIDRLLTALKHLPAVERQRRVEMVAQCAGVSLPSDLMMTGADVRRLAASGMGIGAHTVRHPILAVLEESAARQEIAEGREALQGLVRQPVRLFAYPNGKPNRDYRARDVALVRSLGFDAAFSTAWGTARRSDDAYELPRFTPWDRTPARWATRLARNYFTPVARAAA